MSRRVRAVAVVAVVASAVTLSLGARADQADASTPGAGASRDWLAKPAGPAASAAAPDAAPWRTLAGLLGLSTLGGAVLWARRRRAVRADAGESLRLDVVSAAKVGPKAQVVVARVGDRTILLGVTDSSVRRLAWLSDGAHEVEVANRGAGVTSVEPAPANDVADVPPPAPAPQPGFADILRTALGRPPAAPVAPAIHPARSAPEPVEPAVALAEATRDVVRPMTIRRPVAAEAPTMLDVEDQAAGLAALLAKRRPERRRAG